MKGRAREIRAGLGTRGKGWGRRPGLGSDEKGRGGMGSEWKGGGGEIRHKCAGGKGDNCSTGHERKGLGRLGQDWAVKGRVGEIKAGLGTKRKGLGDKGRLGNTYTCQLRY